MSDSTSPSKTPEGDKDDKPGGAKGDGKDDPKPTSAHDEHLEKARRERDKHKQRADALEEEKRKAEEAAAAAKGDIESLRKSHTDRETKLTKDLDRLKSERDTAVIQSQVLPVLAKLTDDTDLIYSHYKDRLEVAVDEKGTPYVRVKDDGRSIQKFFDEEITEKHPNNRKNDRAPGTGTPGSKQDPKRPTTKDDLLRMTSDERKAAFAANPDLRKLVM